MNKSYKIKDKKCIKKAKEKGLIKTYSQFCETEGSREKEYNLREALEESLHEVKLIKEEKIKAKTWDELYEELKENKD